MARVLITGGAGFIGSHTAEALIAAGHRVRVLDALDPQIHGPRPRFPPDLPPQAERHRGDVRDPRDLRRALAGIDAVYHFAARTGVGQGQYAVADYVDTTVRGTAALLEALLQRGQRLQRFVLASSRAVYGEGAARCPRCGPVHPAPRLTGDMAKGRFDTRCPRCRAVVRPRPTGEDTPADPLSVYALTKKHQEDLCREAARSWGLPLVILRYFNVYGSRQALGNPYTGVVTVFRNLIRQGRTLSLYEGGRPLRDFVHISDVVQANLLALRRGLPAGAVFNVGGGRPVTIAGLAAALARAMGRALRAEDRGEFRAGDIWACTADLRRSRRVLGYRPRTGLAEGLAEFLRWADRQPAPAGPGYDRTVAELKKFGLFGRARS